MSDNNSQFATLNSQLPKGWSWAKLGDIIEKIPTTNKKVKQKEYLEEGKYPIVDQGQELIGGYSNNDDLILNCDLPVIVFGDHTQIKKFINFKFIPGADGIKVIKPKQNFEPKLFYYFLHCVQIPDKGYARHFQFVEKSEIPLPPLPIQHKIVEKIEELFSELDSGIANLRKAKEQIKTYRQSVLAYAFSGKLTNGHPELDSGSEKLNQVQLDNSQLPEGWKWVKLGEISRKIQYGYTESATTQPIGPKFLRITDIQNGNVNWNEVPYCKIPINIKTKYILNEGDIVFARTGATVGKSFLIGNSIQESIFASYLIRIQLEENVNKKFVYLFFQSNNYWRQITEGQVGIGQPNVNGTKLSKLLIPSCPLEEQQIIVSEIERRFSVADKLEQTINESLNKAEQLKQSILKKAFEGKLVE